MKALAVFVVVATLLSACSKERFYENVYEGVRVRNQLEDSADGVPSNDPPMTYEQYEAERKKSEER